LKKGATEHRYNLGLSLNLDARRKSSSSPEKKSPPEVEKGSESWVEGKGKPTLNVIRPRSPLTPRAGRGRKKDAVNGNWT